ncbi:MAG: DUF1302 family protein, partial [Dokdonella sp.]
MKTCKTIQTGSRMRRPALSILSLSLAVALAGVAGQAEAFEFGDPDGFNATINTTIGYGIGWRTQDAADDLIGKAQFNPLVSALGLGSQAQREARGRYSVNGDDGDLAYDKWSPISNAVNATVEIN